MQSFNTLIRRTAAALGAIAALTVSGIATTQAQQTVTLTGAGGNSCAFSGAMTVKPDGSLEIICTTSSSPGTFTLFVPVNMATGTTTTGSQARIARSGGSTGAVDVAVQATGAACTLVSASTMSWAGGESGSKNLTISAGGTPGACVIGFNPSAGASVPTSGAATITVVDGDAPVEFAFQSSITAATVGNAVTTITATRTGGPNGAWEVPFTLAGPLSASASAPLRGTLSATRFVFGPGASSANVTYTPPTTTPTSPALPADLVLTLGTPVGGTPAPAAGQTASLGLVTTNTLTLNGPAVGCPAETTSRSLGSSGQVNHQREPSGSVVTWALPTTIPAGKVSGTFGLYATSYTFPNSPFTTEIHINKCKGLVQPTTDGCYINSGSDQLISKIWFTALLPGTKFDTAARIGALGHCYAPPAQGPWYVNVRHTYTSCKTAGSCGWHAIWKEYSF